MENDAAIQTFRETKDIDLSGSESDADSYESLSVGGFDDDEDLGGILEVISDDEMEDGEVVEVDSDVEDNKNRSSSMKRNSKINKIWSDVVTEQVLSTSMGQINQKPVPYTAFEIVKPSSDSRRRSKKSKRRRKNSKLEEVQSEKPAEDVHTIIMPAKLLNYRDLDAENEIESVLISAPRPPSATGTNGAKPPVDFNALVKAVEKSREVKQKGITSRLGAPISSNANLNVRKSSSRKSSSMRRKRPSALQRLEIDNRIKIDASFAPENLVAALSKALHEQESIDTLRNAVSVLGVEKCVEIFEKTVAKEKNGGITIMDGSRRKTPGGVFFYLIKTGVEFSPEIRQQIFAPHKEATVRKKRHRRNHGNKKKTKSANGSIGSNRSNATSMANLDNDDDSEVLEEGETAAADFQLEPSSNNGPDIFDDAANMEN